MCFGGGGGGTTQTVHTPAVPVSDISAGFATKSKAPADGQAKLAPEASTSAPPKVSQGNTGLNTLGM